MSLSPGIKIDKNSKEDSAKKHKLQIVIQNSTEADKNPAQNLDDMVDILVKDSVRPKTQLDQLDAKEKEG